MMYLSYSTIKKNKNLSANASVLTNLLTECFFLKSINILMSSK